LIEITQHKKEMQRKLKIYFNLVRKRINTVQSNGNTTNENGLIAYTIYCAFKQPEGTFNPNAVQKRVITVSGIISKCYATSSPSKASGGVHFHVETTSALEIAKTKKNHSI